MQKLKIDDFIVLYILAPIVGGTLFVALSLYAIVLTFHITAQTTWVIPCLSICFCLGVALSLYLTIRFRQYEIKTEKEEEERIRLGAEKRQKFLEDFLKE